MPILFFDQQVSPLLFKGNTVGQVPSPKAEYKFITKHQETQTPTPTLSVLSLKCSWLVDLQANLGGSSLHYQRPGFWLFGIFGLV
jgi:hypothetical protein